MKKTKYILLVLMMALLMMSCGKAEKEETESTEDITAEVPEDAADAEPVMLFGHFDAQTLEGEEVTEKIFANADLTMVNIWGTFCGPCIEEMPYLGEISREYEEKGLQMVGVLCDVFEPGDETALEIVNETKADYMHLVASEDLTRNVLQYVSSVPTTVFIDKDGYLVGEVYAGARDKTTWELIINQYLPKVQ